AAARKLGQQVADPFDHDRTIAARRANGCRRRAGGGFLARRRAELVQGARELAGGDVAERDRLEQLVVGAQVEARGQAIEAGGLQCEALEFALEYRAARGEVLREVDALEPRPDLLSCAM